MRTDLCDQFGIEYPIFAFTPSEHVAAAVSRAGGLGVSRKRVARLIRSGGLRAKGKRRHDG